MLRPILTCEAFWDFAEAGNSEPQSDETIKKANKPNLTNRLKEHFLDEALHAQFRQPRFRENNSTPLFSNVGPSRIIVVLN